MKKYRVTFEQTLTGYIDVFADNPDHAIYKLIKQPPLHGQLVIETEDIDYGRVILLNKTNETNTKHKL